MEHKLITNEEIEKTLKRVASEINSTYNEVTLLVCLTGGVYTAIDLSKQLTIPCKLEFVKASSYGSAEISSGIVEVKWLSKEKGADLGDVIIVDDICDTGRTLQHLKAYLELNYKYSSLKTFCLLDKPSRREVDIESDFKGITIEDKFVYGYGLDVDAYKRNLKDIWYHED